MIFKHFVFVVHLFV